MSDLRSHVSWVATGSAASIGRHPQFVSPALAHEAGISATNVHWLMLMPSTSHKIAAGMRRLSVLLLLFGFVSASLTCSAMAWTPVASGHPCCPHSQQRSSDRCATIGCIGTVPGVLTNSAIFALELPAVVLVRYAPAAESPLSEVVPATLAVHPPPLALFVAHHEFLI